MSYYNLIEQREYSQLPKSYVGTSPYPSATWRHYQDGFREVVPFVVPEGHVVIAGTRQIIVDGDTVREEWQTQTEAQAEAARQAAKPDALKQTENNFYELIHAIFGDYTKRGFDDIGAALESLKATNFQLATELSLKLLSIDAAGKRYDARWWDDAVRHNEVTP